MRYILHIETDSLKDDIEIELENNDQEKEYIDNIVNIMDSRGVVKVKDFNGGYRLYRGFDIRYVSLACRNVEAVTAPETL